MAPQVFMLIKLLFNPDVSKKLILQMALKQMSAIGYAKVAALLLSLLTVGVSSVIRIPQIRKILNPKLLENKIKVVNGLSLETYSIESFNYLVHVVFNSQNNNSFLNYGESLLLGLQNVIIILLIKYYRAIGSGSIPDLQDKTWKESAEIVGRELAEPVGWILGTSLFLTKLAPTSLITLLQILNIPISIISKLPQIRQNSILKTTTHLSSITLHANVAGSLIRVYTTIQDLSAKSKRSKVTSGDWVLLGGYLTSLTLNSVLVGQQYFYDGNQLNKKEEEEEEPKKSV
ncbi:predicted protein [Scheffersomyces stipitis CBS 6054]|uniref:Solute carrier family 66 member 3 n=1 Tax=Scheffersomyces stipitis (strain ATCC 58785 / CBS 6054 / NBRC 10063 / NRRL Y-11545) TaxID=322104 RepID=A3LN96_PICST|nr:predicted protein [Scheffersomyces stipitis CBS 6054]ABN64292.2 predicted protein [Scheffersomyces stipitis CBS 6054]KAG2736036.1 hypothetical protein G9P44_000126 [Scheffersomyces stipitis]